MLAEARPPTIVFGTDEEAAVIKAITACFPHLRKNYTQPIMSEILSKIVDAGGLLNVQITFLTVLPAQRNLDRGENLSGLLSGHFPVPEFCR
jgi:hypothetical protein